MMTHYFSRSLSVLKPSYLERARDTTLICRTRWGIDTIAFVPRTAHMAHPAVIAYVSVCVVS